MIPRQSPTEKCVKREQLLRIRADWNTRSKQIYKEWGSGVEGIQVSLSITKGNYGGLYKNWRGWAQCAQTGKVMMAKMRNIQENTVFPESFRSDR